MAIGEQRLSHRMLAPLLRPAGRRPRPAGDQLAAAQPAASQLAAPLDPHPSLDTLLQEQVYIDSQLRVLAQATVSASLAGSSTAARPLLTLVQLQGHGLSKPDHVRALLAIHFEASVHEGKARTALRLLSPRTARRSGSQVATARLRLLACDTRRSMLVLGLRNKHTALADQAEAAQVGAVSAAGAFRSGAGCGA